MSREVITRDNWQPTVDVYLYKEGNPICGKCPCGVAILLTGEQPGLLICTRCRIGRWMPRDAYCELVPEAPVTLLPGCESGCCPTVAA